MTKKQITLTLDQSHIDSLQEYADSTYEGNISMVLRFIQDL